MNPGFPLQKLFKSVKTKVTNIKNETDSKISELSQNMTQKWHNLYESTKYLTKNFNSSISNLTKTINLEHEANSVLLQRMENNHNKSRFELGRKIEEQKGELINTFADITAKVDDR